jgi:hypothetical protein
MTCRRCHQAPQVLPASSTLPASMMLMVGNAVPEAEQGLQMGRLISLLVLPMNVCRLYQNRYCGSGVGKPLPW